MKPITVEDLTSVLRVYGEAPIDLKVTMSRARWEEQYKENNAYLLHRVSSGSVEIHVCDKMSVSSLLNGEVLSQFYNATIKSIDASQYVSLKAEGRLLPCLSIVAEIN